MNEKSVLQTQVTRDHFIVYAGLLLIFLVGWASMGYMAWAMQHMDVVDMWMPPRLEVRSWQLHDFAMLFSMWAVMMIAMMTPSIAPMVSLFVTVNHNKHQIEQAYVPTFIFLLGYLFAWVIASALISVLQYLLHVTDLLNPMMDSRSFLLSGSILIVAGIYQWTPLKDSCLTVCRTPLSFLMTRWRDGAVGAIRMGFEHGIYCVGCCWALMAIMFAVGVMNFLWMIIIAFFVLIEKVSPFSPYLFRFLSGLALVFWGVFWLWLQP